MAGCAKEAPKETPPGSVTFTLTVPELELATKTPGAGAENGTASDVFAFYRFGENDGYEALDVVPYAGLTPGGEHTLTYSLTMDGDVRGMKKFVVLRAPSDGYFPKLGSGSAIGDVLNAVAEFPEDCVRTPMVMSSEGENGGGYVTVADVSRLDNRVAVSLSRRLARIDFLNDEAASGIVLDRIFVRNARRKAFLGHVDLLPQEECSGRTLEIPAAELANGGRSIYLCPTVLTGDAESRDKTSVWATTRLAGKAGGAGPVLRLKAGTEVRIKANCLYQLNSADIGGAGTFDISIKDWEDGTYLDWIPMEGGIRLPDEKAVLFKGTEIQGNYVKIGTEAAYPYVIKSILMDRNPEQIRVVSDGGFPFWLKVESTVAAAEAGLYRHEITYTVSKPTDRTLFAITYFEGSRDDRNILAVGFADPYPGTPLPCLTWGGVYYSPTHARQSTYLANNTADKAFFAGEKAYTLDSKENFTNDKAVNPCPKGWKTLDDQQAESFLKWITSHVKSMDSDYVYACQWLNKVEDGSYVRFLAGYPRSGKTPTWKDFACFGTWPHVAWANMDPEKLVSTGGTYGDQWTVETGYAIPYRCIRSKEGWN